MKKMITITLYFLLCACLFLGCDREPAPEATTKDRDLAIESTGDGGEIDGLYDDDSELAVDHNTVDETTTTGSGEETTTANSDEETDEADKNSPKDNLSKDPTKAYSCSGTFNGFIDGHSVEITLEDGSYQTFFVYEEELYEALSLLAEKEEPPYIHFTYTGRDGQVTPEMIELN